MVQLTRVTFLKHLQTNKRDHRTMASTALRVRVYRLSFSGCLRRQLLLQLPLDAWGVHRHPARGGQERPGVGRVLRLVQEASTAPPEPVPE